MTLHDPRTVDAVATLLGSLLDDGLLDDPADATALPTCAASGLQAHATATTQRARAVARRTDRGRGLLPFHASGRPEQSHPVAATHGTADTSPTAATVHPGAAALTRGGLATETQAPTASPREAA